ncbi:MAG TPA: PDR/VanB family oxidoreductase [Ramlibacter sp.]|jgi:vanillate O-demethylase ferredoxin subunit|nr:PDR/VanB family oxidoreductase [Ramlibacter sp.]
MTQIEVKVLRRTQEAEDIVSFELARADGAPLPAFSAGSHIDVHLPGGVARQYSLCNESSARHVYRIAVLRDPKSRGGSVVMHELREGHYLTISEPRNHFPLVHAVRTLLFAGGIGVTPLLAMAQRLAAVGADFELHYCTRSMAKAAFMREIAASPFAARTHFHFDDGAEEQKLQLAKLLAQVEPQTHLYVCGPSGFIQYVTDWAKGCGWPAGQIHVEHFAGAAQDTSGDREFQVKVASTGQLVTVPADKTVVKALADAGFEVLTSCEQGVCGTCITRVLEGECDHRDMYFTDEEKSKHDQFTPCCSRAKSPVLVLDL